MRSIRRAMRAAVHRMPNGALRRRGAPQLDRAQGGRLGMRADKPGEDAAEKDGGGGEDERGRLHVATRSSASSWTTKR